MEDYIKVTVLENEIEAQLLDSILTERDIPHIMRSYHDTAYDGLSRRLNPKSTRLSSSQAEYPPAMQIW